MMKEKRCVATTVIKQDPMGNNLFLVQQASVTAYDFMMFAIESDERPLSQVLSHIIKECSCSVKELSLLDFTCLEVHNKKIPLIVFLWKGDNKDIIDQHPYYVWESTQVFQELLSDVSLQDTAGLDSLIS